MRGGAAQVLWSEDQKPVYSVDVHAPSGFVATGGGDTEIKLWRLSEAEDGASEGASSVPPVASEGAAARRAAVPRVQHVNTLELHGKAVNCVRFSPRGDLLASAGDGGEVYVWRNVMERQGRAFGSSRGEGAGEGRGEGRAVEVGEEWSKACILRGHGMDADVYDLAWSPDGRYLMTASVENTSLVFDVGAACSGAVSGAAARVECLNLHDHYVQGVAWDPLDGYVVTTSCDRKMCVYLRTRTEDAVRAPVFTLYSFPERATIPVTRKVRMDSQGRARTILTEGPSSAAAATTAGEEDRGTGEAAEMEEVTKDQKVNRLMFRDQTLASFFRRPAWAPDGSCLVVPSGQYWPIGGPAGGIGNCAYVFARGDLERPVALLPAMPGEKKATVAVRFAPWLFALRPPGEGAAEAAKDALVNLPHRMVFAVATMEEVIVYDTQDLGKPVAVVGGLHLATLTDIAWVRERSPTAAGGGAIEKPMQYVHRIVVSSSDGFCSIVTFDAGELGEPLPEDQYPSEMLEAAKPKEAEPVAPAPVAVPVAAAPMEVDGAAVKSAQPVLQDNSNGEKPAKRRIAPVAM